MSETEKTAFSLENMLDRRERRRLGLGILDCARVAKRLKEEGLWVGTKEAKANLVIAAIIDENPTAWVDADRDWSSFFAALMEFMMALMPIIEMFMAFM